MVDTTSGRQTTSTIVALSCPPSGKIQRTVTQRHKVSAVRAAAYPLVCGSMHRNPCVSQVVLNVGVSSMLPRTSSQRTAAAPRSPPALSTDASRTPTSADRPPAGFFPAWHVLPVPAPHASASAVPIRPTSQAAKRMPHSCLPRRTERLASGAQRSSEAACASPLRQPHGEAPRSRWQRRMPARRAGPPRSRETGSSDPPGRLR